MKLLLSIVLVLGAFAASASTNKVVVCANEISGNFYRLEFAAPSILRVQFFNKETSSVKLVASSSRDEKKNRVVKMYVAGSIAFLTLPLELFETKKISPEVLLASDGANEILVCRN